jgi:hypothetical protein
MDRGWGEQRHHLLHRPEDGADWVHPREHFLPGNFRL